LTGSGRLTDITPDGGYITSVSSPQERIDNEDDVDDEGVRDKND
jgi:hypothetical protein